MGDIAFLTDIILLFASVEVHAVHANEMNDPKRQFPMAMLIASVAVILLLTLGSFVVATVLPDKAINLQEGLMKAFQQIFTRFEIDWATPVVCLLLAFGGIGGVMSWISGPSRGLLWTAQEDGVQISILIIQGLIVTVLALAQLAQFGAGVGDFCWGGEREINRLAGARSRLERVVTTLGIFFRCGGGSDGACICAIRFARRTGRCTVIGAWCAAFVLGGG